LEEGFLTVFFLGGGGVYGARFTHHVLTVVFPARSVALAVNW
jgi:hypothetical protein